MKFWKKSRAVPQQCSIPSAGAPTWPDRILVRYERYLKIALLIASRLTCEFYFKESVDLRCRKLSKDKATQFKDLSIKLLEWETPECYDALKGQLLKVISGETEESPLWDFKERVQFQSICPLWTQTEINHGGWAQKVPPPI